MAGRNIFTILFSVLCLMGAADAQQVAPYKPTVSRILFLLDGSGSMKEGFDGTTKFESAKALLHKFTDSVGRKNPNVEFALRVFGHQFPRVQNNCTDSKLILPFSKNSFESIRPSLDKLNPQGQTPISYSLEQAAADFPADEKSLNSIILITDGLETCKGDPCKAAQALVDRRITLKPFIIGMNVTPEDAARFNCVGTYFDTKSEAALSNTIGYIINQTLNTTTAQVNLLDGNGNPSVTNVPFTLYDHSSGKAIYNFIHALDQRGNPDTLYLDPVGVYDLEVHTFPPVRKEGIELNAGKHNLIALDVPAGELQFSCMNTLRDNNAQALIRKKGQTEILNVQDYNEWEQYLRGDYDFEILTTPVIYFDTTVLSSVRSVVKVEEYGLLSVISNTAYIGSIHQTTHRSPLVQRVELKAANESFKLQPGDYSLILKPVNDYRTSSSRTIAFRIEANRTTVITL